MQANPCVSTEQNIIQTATQETREYTSPVATTSENANPSESQSFRIATQTQFASVLGNRLLTASENEKQVYKPARTYKDSEKCLTVCLNKWLVIGDSNVETT